MNDNTGEKSRKSSVSFIIIFLKKQISINDLILCFIGGINSKYCCVNVIYRTMLARFRDMKRAELYGDPKKERRPYLTSDCKNLQEAEKWRHQIVREITKKVSRIQNRITLFLNHSFFFFCKIK